MQPTELEIELERETLRDIRRRSTIQVATVDPDLPSTSSSSLPDDLDTANVEDPLHLFWVPAHVHPELAPGEFRAFLKENANLERSRSTGGGLGRKKSMLSRQYSPSANDNVESESVKIKPRRRVSTRGDNVPQLTIEDLQNLEQLAEEASKSDDPSQLRSVLRRSLSLNVPLASQELDEQDAPIIVPQRPGQILRRAARTKIRKPGLSGDGGGHRFPASRRPQPAADPETATTLFQPPTLEDHEFDDRPRSFSEESSIYDSYAHDDDEPSSYEPPPQAIPSQPIQLQHPVPQHQPTPPPVPPPPVNIPPPPLSIPVQPPPQPQIQTPIISPRSPSPPSAASRSSPSPARRDKDKKGGGLFGFSKKQKEEKEKDGFFGSLFGGSKKKQEEQPPFHGSSGPAKAAALLGASKSKPPSTSPVSPQAQSHMIPGAPFARYPIHVERAVYRLSHIKLANPRRPLHEQVLISNLMFWYLGVINKAQTQATNPTPANSEAQTSDKDTEREEREAQEAAAREREREQAEAEAREKEAREREREREREVTMKKESGRRGSLTKTSGVGPGSSRRAEMPVKGPQYDLQHRVIEQEYGPQINTGPNGGRGMIRAESAPPLQSPGRSPTTPFGNSAPYHGYPNQGYQRPPLSPSSPQSPHSLGYSSSPDLNQNPMNQYPGYPVSSATSSSYMYDAGEVHSPAASPTGLPPGAMRAISPEQPHSWSMGTNSGYLNGPGPYAPASPKQSHRAASPHRSTSPRRSPSPPGHHGPTTVRKVSGGAKLQGRSHSATAVASQAHNAHPHTHGASRARKKSLTGQRRRSSEGMLVSPTEEDNVPLALWQQQHRNTNGR
ncbi:hypothetical protein SISSUDRAFT_1062575 [Sistotremastrum suecicum HHB10207 ss-3]|uniref:Protein Zds1 C-terminal domain-containing protein n=1 Tax=Sistotremastrum suecicum HHB10207 ss-3 TaxID=1314776 RepID=A0A166CRD9_9AGAM|nr:hypothetical protein SISSUDRAFT_1062575 [Sistotremastrum suecicum HHB10207 ss-3]